MRITFVKAGGFGMSGGDRVIAIYGERLQRRGHEVTVVSSPIPGPTLREHLRALRRTGRFARRYKHAGSHLANSTVPHSLAKRPGSVIDHDVPDADVVIATWWETAEWVSKLSAAKGVKVYFLQGYEALPYQPKERVDATWRLPMHKITISSWLAEKAREQFGDRDISLVFNSVDTAQFSAPPRERGTPPTVGMLYNEAPSKGLRLALSAVEQVRDDFPDLRLVTFGHTRTQDVQLPPGTRHVVHPAQDNIKNIYAQCDVWLCASYSEGFHLPPLEAMACRTPVVSTRVGGPIDLIEDGVQGYLVPIGDGEALASALKRVLRLSGKDWRKMSDEAYATATRYSWDDATDLFEAALYRAVEENQTAAAVLTGREIPRR